MCYHRSFKPLVMFFGLCNSLGMFQVMMNEIFTDIEDICVIYINNLLIFTKSDSKEKHDKVVLFKVQEYLKVKGQRNKSSDGNIQLVKVNNGYHQKWGFEKSQIDRINQKITH